MSRSRIDKDVSARIADGALRPLSRDELFGDRSKLKGRVVVITGGGSGLGRAFAVEAAKNGALVVIGDVNEQGLEETLRLIKAANGTARGQRCDVTIWEDQLALFELAQSSFGRVDIAVANAGIGDTSQGQFLKEELEKPDVTTLDVDVVGVVYTARLGLHYLRRNPAEDGKAIILIGSYASFYGSPVTMLYAPAKHAVLGFGRSLKFLCAHDGINCTVICPYFVDTPIMQAIKPALQGETLGTIDDVVGALTYASTAGIVKLPPGQAILVDPRGVLVTNGGKFSPMALPKL
ncbi:NAD(P)-binding protein [Exidia glandulosa HHB12029]|uniref:NAD(P)-binding protein n=1 Tax=Exidia glandulosa HHB12029 TaxID=1314781 RepID=A0A165GXJ0_EXIGL|nr:NAD(P)-binding protein [Exidia glandulosa HHB12029]